jgi:hypothetical protein
MLEVIAEGTEGIPEARGEDQTILSPLQLLSLKMSSTNRGGGGDCSSGVGSVPAPDWRKRRIGHIHLEDGWRPEIVAGLEQVPAGEDRGCSHSPALKHHEDEDFEDPELVRRSSLAEEEEEEERWEEVGGEQRKSGGEDNWLVDRRHGGESGGAQRGSSKTSSALLGVDFGTRRAKSPVTVQESRQKAVGD